MNKDEEKLFLKSLGLSKDSKFIPIKIYCSNFTKRRLGVIFCNREVGGFLIKYLPDDMIWAMGVDRDGVIYINFKNKSRLKGQNRSL